MKYAVFLTRDAERDLEELHNHLLRHETPERAERVLDQIESAFSRLESLPNRGNIPRELSSLGIREFREVFFKPYRIVYQVMDQRVIVLLIADGRRDMQALLERRLLEA